MSDGPDFADFYTATFHRLAAQLSLYAGSVAEAQDVVQEAMVRALARWPTISRYEDPAGWVRKVAWNLATSRWRRLKRYISLTDWNTRPDDPPDLDHVALTRALAKLPPRQRQAIILHYLMGLPIAEIATICHVAQGTVKSWLHRGRTALAGFLTDSSAPEVDRV